MKIPSRHKNIYKYRTISNIINKENWVNEKHNWFSVYKILSKLGITDLTFNLEDSLQKESIIKELSLIANKKYCSKCEKLQLKSKFSQSTSTSDKLDSICKLCVNKKTSEIEIKEKNLIKYRFRKSIKGIKKRIRAKQREYNLDDYLDVLYERYKKGICELTGIQFNFSSSRDWNSPSIDRINSDKGYTYDNVRIICFCMNIALNSWGDDILWNVVEEWRKTKKGDKSG